MELKMVWKEKKHMIVSHHHDVRINQMNGSMLFAYRLNQI